MIYQPYLCWFGCLQLLQDRIISGQFDNQIQSLRLIEIPIIQGSEYPLLSGIYQPFGLIIYISYT